MLTSCDNFLKNGQDVKNEVLDTIAYNNAPSCTVNFSDEGMGQFLGNKKETFKVGYASQVQFEVNTDDYYFIGLEAVTNSEKTPLTSYVKFETADQNNRSTANGIYKYNITILKERKDILIIPECMLIPKITSVYPPKDNTSYPQDTSIKIYFNKAIKLSDFADQNGFLKNIIITTGSQDLLDTQDGKTPYYKSPYLEDERKTLVIPFVSGNYLISDNQSKDIKVTLQLEGLKDAVEGENVLFAQNEYSFTYKINGEKDSTPPVLKTLNIAFCKKNVSD